MFITKYLYIVISRYGSGGMNMRNNKLKGMYLDIDFNLWLALKNESAKNNMFLKEYVISILKRRNKR